MSTKHTSPLAPSPLARLAVPGSLSPPHSNNLGLPHLAPDHLPPVPVHCEVKGSPGADPAGAPICRDTSADSQCAGTQPPACPCRGMVLSAQRPAWHITQASHALLPLRPYSPAGTQPAVTCRSAGRHSGMRTPGQHQGSCSIPKHPRTTLPGQPPPQGCIFPLCALWILVPETCLVTCHTWAALHICHVDSHSLVMRPPALCPSPAGLPQCSQLLQPQKGSPVCTLWATQDVPAFFCPFCPLSQDRELQPLPLGSPWLWGS